MENKITMFDAFKIMNQKDAENNTALLGVCPEMIAANTCKGGGKVEMGVPKEALMKIFHGEVMPVLFLIDKKEYFSLMGK